MIGGLLDSDKLMALQGNPLFNIGMGLMSSRYDPKVNPFQAAMSGLASSSKFTEQQEDRERMEKLRSALSGMIGSRTPRMGDMSPAMGLPNMSLDTDQYIRELEWRLALGGGR